MKLDELKRLTTLRFAEEESDDPLEAEPEPEGGEPSAEPKMVPLDVIPKELRDMDPNEMKFFLSRTLSGMKEANEANRSLQEQISDLRARIEEKPEPEDEPDPDDDVPLSELIIENPEKAVERIAKQKGWITTLQDTVEKSNDALFDTVARSIDGFEEYEDDVRDALRKSGAPVTRATIVNAYYMMRGKRSVEEESRARREQGNPEKVKPAKEPASKKIPEESDLEREMREAHGMSREDWLKYRSDEFEIKVPV